MKPLLDKLKVGMDLNANDVAVAMTHLLSAETDAQDKAEFLRLLHKKGETAEEITAFVGQLIDRAIDPMLDPAKFSGPLIDVCGTGGAGQDLFNISTTIMFILAAGGAVVVKHGNRSVTSCCGSADVLEALGVRLVWEPEDLKECVERHGMGFIFARHYHPAFRALAEMRTQLAKAKTRTIFNLLGPLLNPARPPRQLIGVYASRLTSVFGEVVRQLGRERAWIVHGTTGDGIGLDDISTAGVTTLAELNSGRVTTAVVDVRWLGVPESTLDDVRGGDAKTNAETLEGILRGEVKGAKRDLAVVNAAGAFVVAGLARDLAQGIWMAQEQIDNGCALKKLRALQDYGA